MPGPSKVIVVAADGSDSGDARAALQLQLGFAREGVPTMIAPVSAGRPQVPPDATAVVVVTGTGGRVLELLHRTRRVVDEQLLVAPIMLAGSGVSRADATTAGADEVILMPMFLRDVVTIGRLLRTRPAGQREHMTGSLAETTGVYTLVRAFAALGRSAVLTMLRGLRRGEIRFFHGEVTSAQVGLIHGQAALHQLLLWTEARFEFRHEDIVRRQQIPLSPDELFADAERFLEGIRDASGSLSPSLVLEQDVEKLQKLGAQLPSEVTGVLRMFDGHRVLADVLEDSPYRVFETLAVAQHAVEVGLLRVLDAQRPKATWRAVLSIEEWLVGGARPTAKEPGSDLASRDTGPVTRESGPLPSLKGARRKRKKRRSSAPPRASVPAPSKPEIDWGPLVPRTIKADFAPLSGVVPAAHASGEIELPTREAPREKLEALMDTDKRDRIFPTDIGLEPSVVFEGLEAVADPANKVAASIAAAERVAAERAAASARAAAERADADKAAASARAAAHQAAADKAAADKAAAASTAAQEAAAAKVAADKAAADKATAAKIAAQEAAAAKVAADKAAADKAAAAKTAAQEAAAAKVAADKAAAAKTAADKAAADKAAAAKTAADKAAADKVADDMAAADKAAANARAAAEKATAAKTTAYDALKGVENASGKPKLDDAARALADAKARADEAARAAALADARAKAEARADAEDAKLRAEAAEWAKQQAAARARAADAEASEAEEFAKRLADAKAKVAAQELAASPADASVAREGGDAAIEDDEEAEVWAAAKARAEAADAQAARAKALLGPLPMTTMVRSITPTAPPDD